MLNEKMTSAERATLIGLVQVTLRTDESARLRYLTGTEVTDALGKGAHGCKEVMDEKANSAADVKQLDDKHITSADHFAQRFLPQPRFAASWVKELGSRPRGKRS